MIDPKRSTLRLCQNQSLSETIHRKLYENEFRLQVHFHANQTHFHTRTRFETEAQGNSEMGY